MQTMFLMISGTHCEIIFFLRSLGGAILETFKQPMQGFSNVSISQVFCVHGKHPM